jgi:hypothetical protein
MDTYRLYRIGVITTGHVLPMRLHFRRDRECLYPILVVALADTVNNLDPAPLTACGGGRNTQEKLAARLITGRFFC